MSQNAKWVPKKDWLLELDQKIPRNEAGDPAFEDLGYPESPNAHCLRQVFTEPQICYLVNKALYALEYQRVHHRKRAQEERDVLGPIRKKVKEMFGLSSYLNATEEQLMRAAKALKEEKEV